MPNLKYEDSENIKIGCVDMVVFNLHQIKQIKFFWDTRYIFGINNYRTLISQILTIFGPLGEKFDFFIFLGFEAKSDFDHKTFKIKSHSTRASEPYMNDKSPIHGRETALTFRFSAETFESDFNSKYLHKKIYSNNIYEQYLSLS